MKKREVVMIYEDPVTKQKPEGKAKLVRKDFTNDQTGLEYWQVRFVDYPDDGIFGRYIQPE